MTSVEDTDRVRSTDCVSRIEIDGGFRRRGRRVVPVCNLFTGNPTSQVTNGHLLLARKEICSNKRFHVQSTLFELVPKSESIELSGYAKETKRSATKVSFFCNSSPKDRHWRFFNPSIYLFFNRQYHMVVLVLAASKRYCSVSLDTSNSGFVGYSPSWCALATRYVSAFDWMSMGLVVQ